MRPGFPDTYRYAIGVVSVLAKYGVQYGPGIIVLRVSSGVDRSSSCPLALIKFWGQAN